MLSLSFCQDNKITHLSQLSKLWKQDLILLSQAHTWKFAIYTDYTQEHKASYLSFQLCNFQIQFIQVFVHKGDQRL